MESLNNSFFFVIDKIISLQLFFHKEAWAIGRTVLLISLILAAINYALTGEGFKSSLIKIGKATVFFIVIMLVYPRIIAFITEWTFEKARASTFLGMEQYLNDTKSAMANAADEAAAANKAGTYGQRVMKSGKVSEENDPNLFFEDFMTVRDTGAVAYTVVAPAAALKSVMLVAGECITYAGKDSGWLPEFGRIIIGLACGFFVMVTGVLAVLEYLMAYLEFMLVTSVGIIFFPLSLWEGSKFMAEKLVGAIIGFFVKLLFCNICLFLMLYGFYSLARGFTENPFTGNTDQILMVVFVSLLFFFLCKSGPGLAQSLLSGVPSLSASGAISAAAGAVAGAGAAFGAARQAGGAFAGGAAKAAFGGVGALTQAAAAGQAVKDLGGGRSTQAGAFMKSLGGSAKEAVKASGGELARSLLGGSGQQGSGSSGGSGGTGAGVNRHSQTQHFLQEKNADGNKKSFGEYLAARKETGTNAGIDHMAKKEARDNPKA
ncbi:MAG: type IV secretion system protein [Treponema sp.]|jgi:type IV secretory pathway TrbL component|nr:type IV secretion system protein [Treponema sp.]